MSDSAEHLCIDRAVTINDFISMLLMDCLLTQRQEDGRTDYLLSARSVLFPTSMIMTSLPLSVLTSSIHFVVCWKELTSEREKETNKRHGIKYSGDEEPQLSKTKRKES